MQLPLRGLYAITDNKLIKTEKLIDTVEQAIIGGAKIIQYRDKSNKRHFEQAQALSYISKKYQVPLLINDDVALALQVGADGVHIGKNDVELSTARAVLGKDAIIGVSCYNQLTKAQQAINAGADYVAFGRFFSSRTKPEAVWCSVEKLRQARKMFHCPLVAIGGITPDNGAELIKAGADCLAVINGLFGQIDVTASAQQYARLFNG
ncbi:MAG: thiamine phosphate synthase [Gammaproteobacteria bacterium]|nr:MAG: thiamine phosphate synthase [Gammaproteobacteria bacterium]RKZ43163.1 MAG: thiamine phosphate synthase [Gammaproteobacteria bacterium]RKZ74946.1 MAG: thiamine phosphate synthase [Gammaproteobacteria bacterium]